MKKIAIGPQTLIYPLPSVLVGAKVDGKSNFMAVAWCGIANSTPPMISVALRHNRHTLKGVRDKLTFSVNVPSCELVKETDYCGIISGAKIDKTEVCNFKIFYGKLGDAPLIEQCPVNLECKVVHCLDLGSHVLVIGKIEETYVSENCLTDGKPDVNKIEPFAFSPGMNQQYQALGEVVAKAFSSGKELNIKG